MTSTSESAFESVSGGRVDSSDPFLSNDFYPLKLAHDAVIAALRADESAPDSDLYKRITSVAPSADSRGHLYQALWDDETKGRDDTLNSDKYPPNFGQSLASDNLNDAEYFHNTMSLKNSIPLPPYLRNIIQETRLSSLMGILPQGNMVWVSVDDSIYLWEYGSLTSGGSEKEDFVCFRVPSGQCVVSVGLVKPKLGVFRDIVEWCLVVTTPEEAIICALARETNQLSDGLDRNSSKTKDSHLVLIPTRYEIPTDSVHILSVCGTDDGRIFMGGSDGCLYEMSYEANIPTTSAIGNSMFYNDEDFANDYEYFDSESVVKTIATSGKRALSSLVFGPISSVESRPRKCRKVNHSSFTSSIVSAFVPGFVLKAASAVFGTSPVLTGGPIVNLTLDSDRKTLYALTSRGYIHAFDLDTEITHGKMGCSDHCNPPKLACSVNVTKSVRRYLETVSHGRMYPPTTIGTDYSIASITFPGGGSGAQFGVGGMDGARAILKIADTEVLRKKTLSKSRKSTNGSISRSGSEGYLHPISIHVVPASESRYITLIAITSGGLRYYFSALPDAGTSYSSSSLRPGSRFTLCHIRAPPPLSMNGKNKVVLDHNFGKGVSTLADKNGKERKGTIAKGSYTSGVTILAINCDDRSGDDEVGDSILAISPDYTQNGVVEMSSSKAGQAIANFPNGVNEILSLPIGTSVLPGGHVWDLKSRSLALQKCNSVLRLFFRSTTPSSLSQNDKLPPIFLAASNNRRFANKMFSSESTRDAANGTMKYIVPKSAGIAEVLRQILSGKSRIVTMPPGVSQRRMNAYQMLDRYGCENSGFSLPPKSTGNKGRKIPIAESPSLPFSVINPFPVALSEMSLQHLIIDSNFKDVLALNSGGIYHFVESSPINILHSLFSNSPASSIGSDERVKIFFKRYGHKESCAMCLSIAISPKTNIAIVRKAIQAALSYAYRPCFVRSSQAPGDTSIPAHGINIQPFSQPVHGSDIEGYSFLPSHLHDGLLSLTSRLLRPIWCKPALIVTEGRLIRHKSSGISEQLPAKVELLLNQKTLDDLRRPLAALQKLMKDIFEPAVKDIPGLRASDALMIDVTEDRELPRGTWITQALQYQIQSRHQHDSIPPQLTERELTAAARLREERSIHALYRLVSRTVQLLSLLDLIYRAHLSSHLPEVEFGYIHSLTFSQLVTTRGAQDRIEAMLTKLFYSHNAVTDDRAHGNLFTAESDNLCSLLSQECYLFFSLGSRLSFLGFRNAEVAYTSSSVSKQSEYIAAASKYLREAAKYWHSPSYVIGQGFSLEKKGMFNDSKNAYYAYNSLAVCAIENDTPLARATFVLLQINDIVGLVELCFNCAKNFEIKKSSMISRVASNDEPSPINMLPWEVNLYHAQFNENDDAYSFGYVHGGGTKHTDSKDDNDFVKRTCYALLYYHIGKLLESGTQHPHDSTLADQIISISMSSTDLLFLHGLYAYLFTSGNVDTLLRLDSISLENWLSKNDDAYHLLWRYYTFHNIHWMAGEVMWTRATVAGGENPIEERVECLTKSLGSYSMALRELRSETTMLQRAITSTNLSAEHCLTFKYGNSPSSDELNRAISEIGELIDVAKIQTRVLSVIMSSPNSQNIDEAQLDELKTSLLDVSKIYNEFAAPLGLYEICLAVLQTCNHDDSATISKLWRSIICEELLPCRTRSLSVQNFLLGLQKDSMLEQESVILSKTPIKKENGETLMTFEDGVWIVNVKSRIVGLGRELLGKSMDSFFPTYFIAECLEGLRQVYIESTGIKTNIWSVEILIESGASFPLTLDAYHNIYICQGGKADNNLKLEVLFAIAEILNLWLVASSSQTESTMSMHDSASVLLARYAGNILKQIDNYKSELESFISANPGEISKCYALFDDIEGSLRHKK